MIFLDYFENRSRLFGMPAIKRHVDEHEAATWAAQRLRAIELYEALREQAPDDRMQRIAFLSALPEPSPFDPDMRELINEAKASGRTWREVAVAIGLNQSLESERSAQTRQAWRNKRHQQLQEDAG